MKHYVVLLDWAIDDCCETGISILAVTHTLEEAKEVFAKHIDEERANAESRGWEIYTNEDTDFDSGHFGYYLADHIHLYIEEVN